jgi:DNA-binding NarL/FixJ family response regulator
VALDHSKPRVLVADDNIRVRNGIANMLEDSCDICGEVEDGAEAVRLAVELAPDMVLLDLNMPIMNGSEAAKAIRAISPQTRIVLLSVDDSPRAANFVKTTGADGFVSKNCGCKAFRETIETIMRRSVA